MVDLLTSLGIVPDYTISHSAGELGCAYADGCLTVEQTILSAYFIASACAEGKVICNSMAIVNINYECLKSMCPMDIKIICRNSENSSFVSGPTKSMQKFITTLQVELNSCRNLINEKVRLMNPQVTIYHNYICYIRTLVLSD